MCVGSCNCPDRLICDACSCKCCMFVSCVQPVAMRSAVFYTVCSCYMLVVDAMGDHMAEMYSSMSLVMALYERTLSMGSVLDAWDAVLSKCLLYVNLGSRVRPSIFVCVCSCLVCCC